MDFKCLNYICQGDYAEGASIIAWGYTYDAKLQTTKKGKTVSNFSMIIGNIDGEKKYMYISSWNDTALAAAQITKGDMVMVCGHLERDKYNSEKLNKEVYKIIADCIYNQSICIPSKQNNNNYDDDDLNMMDLPD